MSDILETYGAWQVAEAEAALGHVTKATAAGAKRAFEKEAKELVKWLPVKTKVGVRIKVSRRVDAAEHVVAAEDFDLDGFVRAKGEAFCTRRANVGEELVEVKRRTPSCARCLLVVEGL
jgi:hypothetical protein